MAHLVSIVFFFGLLVALAAILEFTFKAHWAAIVAALRGRSGGSGAGGGDSGSAGSAAAGARAAA